MRDPGLHEDEVATARFTISLDSDDNVRAMQKGLNGHFTHAEIKQMVEASVTITQKIREQINAAMGN